MFHQAIEHEEAKRTHDAIWCYEQAKADYLKRSDSAFRRKILPDIADRLYNLAPKLAAPQAELPYDIVAGLAEFGVEVGGANWIDNCTVYRLIFSAEGRSLGKTKEGAVALLDSLREKAAQPAPAPATPATPPSAMTPADGWEWNINNNGYRLVDANGRSTRYYASDVGAMGEARRQDYYDNPPASLADKGGVNVWSYRASAAGLSLGADAGSFKLRMLDGSLVEDKTADGLNLIGLIRRAELERGGRPGLETSAPEDPLWKRISLTAQALDCAIKVYGGEFQVTEANGRRHNFPSDQKEALLSFLEELDEDVAQAAEGLVVEEDEDDEPALPPNARPAYVSAAQRLTAELEQSSPALQRLLLVAIAGYEEIGLFRADGVEGLVDALTTGLVMSDDEVLEWALES